MKDRDRSRQEVFLKPNLMIRESSVVLKVERRAVRLDSVLIAFWKAVGVE